MSIGSECALRTSPISGNWLAGLMIQKRGSRRSEREQSWVAPHFLQRDVWRVPWRSDLAEGINALTLMTNSLSCGFGSHMDISLIGGIEPNVPSEVKW
jgi:hypothetical protein